MRCKPGLVWFKGPVGITLLVMGWLVAISVFHFRLNVDRGGRRTIAMGYMPVIANLAAPLLDYATREGSGVRFKAVKFASFAEMAAALRNNEIQAAFIIAPLAIVLKQQGVDVRVVYIGNRHESTLVARRGLKVGSIEELAGRTVAVPIRYSGHYLLLQKALAERGLSGEVRLVEMNPPDMASALASGGLDAYFVGEPFAAQTLKSGEAVRVHYVEEMWPGFICNLMIVRKPLIDEAPDLVRRMVTGAVRSGLWAKHHIREAAAIASHYWRQPTDLVEYALGTPEGRIRFEDALPRLEEIQEIADLMVRFGLSGNRDVGGLVDDRFVRMVDAKEVATLAQIFD
ncbi:ABC transporter substrate-binding protein [Desulfococcus sp.]|uniref:ABC transporter substrate-binding protein n=1 Tax=Desulfococcus sp. TaxID=2025834 RepID=UPI0035944367